MADNTAGTQAKHLSLSMGIIDTAAVFLRLWARWRSAAAFAADDYSIVVSLVPLYCMLAIGYMGMSILPLSFDKTLLTSTVVDNGGMGESISTLPPEKVSTFLKVL